jgi:hypothetical protein
LEADVVIADHSTLKEIKITDIKVGQRHRRDMGDLMTLADSIRQEGLLQPIGVTDKLELVFGEAASGPSGTFSRRRPSWLAS